MLLTFSNSSYKYDGRVQDEIWTTSNGRGIARTRTRPNPSTRKLRYQPAFSLGTGKSEWAALDEATQSDWEDFAGITFGYPIQGSPRYMDGETFFANYLTVLRLVDPSAAIPSVPASGPTWQDPRPKFFEIAEWIADIYTLKAETDFYPTRLLFSGLPPTASGFKPDFAGEVIIGNHEFSSGLYANDEFDGVHTMMEDTFGTITAELKIWGRVWEVQDGFIRVIKDPCGPNPGAAPPSEVSFNFELYNGYDMEMSESYIVFTNGSEDVAELYWTDTPPLSNEEGTIELYEGYTTDDLLFCFVHSSWWDGEYGYDELYAPFSINPFEHTMLPVGP